MKFQSSTQYFIGYIGSIMKVHSIEFIHFSVNVNFEIFVMKHSVKTSSIFDRHIKSSIEYHIHFQWGSNIENSSGESLSICLIKEKVNVVYVINSNIPDEHNFNINTEKQRFSLVSWLKMSWPDSITAELPLHTQITNWKSYKCVIV